MKDNYSKDCNGKKKFDLQDRFVDYSVSIIKVTEVLPNTKAGNHICSQILRSGTSPAANYGEAQSAESRPDFIHKLKLALKELWETEVWLKVIARSGMVQPMSKLSPLLEETNELISIMFKSIETSKKKLNDGKR
ncbi:MAG: four helix bundle protein [Planctomycetes bacterium]|nr:four helix bundle protein [Planctomycetota bacterium]